jgi:hypothetical protein
MGSRGGGVQGGQTARAPSVFADDRAGSLGKRRERRTEGGGADNAANRAWAADHPARVGSNRSNPGSSGIRLVIVQNEATLEAAFARIRRVL